MTTDTSTDLKYLTFTWRISSAPPMDELADMMSRYNRYAVTGIPELLICAAGSLMCNGNHYFRENFREENETFIIKVNFTWYPLGLSNLEFYESRDYLKFFKFMSSLIAKN